MKSFAIALPILLFMSIIGSNALPSSNSLLTKERRESYQACIRLRAKAPNFNLKCEKLIENIHSKEVEMEDANSNGVKILSTDVARTRKVNKIEEIKLRNLIKKLTNQNKLRKD